MHSAHNTCIMLCLRVAVNLMMVSFRTSTLLLIGKFSKVAMKMKLRPYEITSSWFIRQKLKDSVGYAPPSWKKKETEGF